MNDSIGKYHSTWDPYEVVQAIWGHNSLHALADLVTDMSVLSGVAHAYDYTVGRKVPITMDVYVVKDRKGLRVMDVADFKEIYGDPLSVREAKRWSEAAPHVRFPEPKGSVTVKNSRTSFMSFSVFGDTDEEMFDDAVRKGREHFGEGADLEINLTPVRVETLGLVKSGKRYYTHATVRLKD
jgi:hypothetical protein